MAAYEKVFYDHRRSKASPPSWHGTNARSRVNLVPPAPRHRLPEIIPRTGFVL
jgi:hypothetical protein